MAILKTVVHTFTLHEDGSLCDCGDECGAKTYAVTGAGEHVCDEDHPCGPEHAGYIIDRKVRKHMQAHGEKNYEAAFDVVFPSLSSRLRDIYSGVSRLFPDSADEMWNAVREDPQEKMRDRASAGEQLDKLARAWMAETGEDDYETALHEMLRRHPTLAARWAGRD